MRLNFLLNAVHKNVICKLILLNVILYLLIIGTYRHKALIIRSLSPQHDWSSGWIDGLSMWRVWVRRGGVKFLDGETGRKEFAVET